VLDRSYYDVGRGLRDIRALLRLRTRGNHCALPPQGRRRKGVRRSAGVRALLGARPTLVAFAHMQIVCAAKM
jgi:hypothetical protein